jgi:hypothetical protein
MGGSFIAAGGNVKQCSCLKTSPEGLQKVKELPYDPAIPFLGLRSKEVTKGTQMLGPTFTEASFTVAKRKIQSTYISKDEWMNKNVSYS